MQRESPHASMTAECELTGELPRLAVEPAFSSLVARNKEAKQRLAHLARTIETDVIPRLVQAHRHATPAANAEPAAAPGQSSKQVAGLSR